MGAACSKSSSSVAVAPSLPAPGPSPPAVHPGSRPSDALPSHAAAGGATARLDAGGTTAWGASVLRGDVDDMMQPSMDHIHGLRIKPESDPGSGNNHRGGGPSSHHRGGPSTAAAAAGSSSQSFDTTPPQSFRAAEGGSPAVGPATGKKPRKGGKRGGRRGGRRGGSGASGGGSGRGASFSGLTPTPEVSVTSSSSAAAASGAGGSVLSLATGSVASTAGVGLATGSFRTDSGAAIATPLALGQPTAAAGGGVASGGGGGALPLGTTGNGSAPSSASMTSPLVGYRSTPLLQQQLPAPLALGASAGGAAGGTGTGTGTVKMGRIATDSSLGSRTVTDAMPVGGTGIGGVGAMRDGALGAAAGIISGGGGSDEEEEAEEEKEDGDYDGEDDDGDEEEEEDTEGSNVIGEDWLASRTATRTASRTATSTEAADWRNGSRVSLIPLVKQASAAAMGTTGRRRGSRAHHGANSSGTNLSRAGSSRSQVGGIGSELSSSASSSGEDGEDDEAEDFLAASSTSSSFAAPSERSQQPSPGHDDDDHHRDLDTSASGAGPLRVASPAGGLTAPASAISAASAESSDGLGGGGPAATGALSGFYSPRDLTATGTGMRTPPALLSPPRHVRTGSFRGGVPGAATGSSASAASGGGGGGGALSPGAGGGGGASSILLRTHDSEPGASVASGSAGYASGPGSMTTSPVPTAPAAFAGGHLLHRTGSSSHMGGASAGGSTILNTGGSGKPSLMATRGSSGGAGAATPTSSGAPSAGGSMRTKTLGTRGQSVRSPSDGAAGAVDKMGVSTAELFEAETFFEVDKEWESLKTLKLVFERAGLDETQQRKFLSALRERVFRTGYIVRQGAPGDDGFYIITDGEVAVTRGVSPVEAAASPASLIVPGDAGPEFVITHLYEGHFFGETALVNDAPRNANVRVMHGEVRVMVMSKDAFKPFLDQDPKFRKMIGELVLKKEETARKRTEMLKAQGGTIVTPEEQRNEVKVSKLTKRGKTSNGKTLINGYVLMQKLGQGSYGVVWLAMSLAHSKKYAMKIVSRALLRRKRVGTNAAQSDEEVLKEVAVMKRLAHPNVVGLFEVIDDPAGDKFYMVQEYLELGPIMTEREYNQPLAAHLARKYFRDLLCGVEYLHFQGVVHRDIKPSNVLISSDGTAKISDFGTAALTKDGTDFLTDVKGTPAFQPPEVFLLEKGQSYSGFAVDIWAVGATLHTMAVGVPPFMADTELELVERLRTEQFRLSTTVQLDPHLRNLLMRCLEKDPEKRIKLRDIINHDWVTEEGVNPLVTRPYAKLDLAATAVLAATPSSVGALSPGGAIGGAGTGVSLLTPGATPPFTPSVGSPTGFSDFQAAALAKQAAMAAALATAAAAASASGAAAAGAASGGAAASSSARGAASVPHLPVGAAAAASGASTSSASTSSARSPAATPTGAAPPLHRLPLSKSARHSDSGRVRGSGGLDGADDDLDGGICGKPSPVASSRVRRVTAGDGGAVAIGAPSEVSPVSRSSAGGLADGVPLRHLASQPHAQFRRLSQSVGVAETPRLDAASVTGVSGVPSSGTPPSAGVVGAAPASITAPSVSPTGAPPLIRAGLIRQGSIDSSSDEEGDTSARQRRGSSGLAGVSPVGRTGIVKYDAGSVQSTPVRGGAGAASSPAGLNISDAISVVTSSPASNASTPAHQPGQPAGGGGGTGSALRPPAHPTRMQRAVSSSGALPGGRTPTTPANTNDMHTAHQEHMRALRLRQHKLLAGHTELEGRDRQLLADQRRLVFHKARAKAEVAEFYVDASGLIAEAPPSLGNSTTTSPAQSTIGSATTAWQQSSTGTDWLFPGSKPTSPSSSQAWPRARFMPARTPSVNTEASSGGGGGSASADGASADGGALESARDRAGIPSTGSWSSRGMMRSIASVRAIIAMQNSAKARRSSSGAGGSVATATDVASVDASVPSSGSDKVMGLVQTKSYQSMVTDITESAMLSRHSSVHRFHTSSVAGDDASVGTSSGHGGATAATPSSVRSSSMEAHMPAGSLSVQHVSSMQSSVTDASAGSASSSSLPALHLPPGMQPKGPPVMAVPDQAHTDTGRSHTLESHSSGSGRHGSPQRRLTTRSSLGSNAATSMLGDTEGVVAVDDIDSDESGAGRGSDEEGAVGPGGAADSERRRLHPVASQRRERPKLHANSLQRVENFLMVTADVDVAAGGGAIVRKVIFRAKGKDGSLSITGGRATAVGQRGAKLRKKGSGVLSSSGGGEDADSESGSNSDDDGDEDEHDPLSPVMEHRGGESDESDAASSSSEASAAAASQKRHGGHAGHKSLQRIHTDKQSTMSSRAGLRLGGGGAGGAGTLQPTIEEGSASDSDDSSDYDGIATVDDMTGNQLASGLGDLLGELAVVEEKPDEDADLMDLGSDEETEWSHVSRRLGFTFPGNKATTPAEVAYMQETSISAGFCSMPDESDDWMPTTGAETARPDVAPLPADAPPVRAEGTWNPTTTDSGRFVCCPVGQFPNASLVFAGSHSVGRRETMEDRCVLVPDLCASLNPTATSGAIAEKPRYSFFAVYDGHNGITTVEALAQSMHFHLGERLGLLPPVEPSPVGSPHSATTGPSSIMASVAGFATSGEPATPAAEMPAYGSPVAVSARTGPSSGEVTPAVVVTDVQTIDLGAAPPFTFMVRSLGVKSTVTHFPARVAYSDGASSPAASTMPLLPGQLGGDSTTALPSPAAGTGALPPSSAAGGAGLQPLRVPPPLPSTSPGTTTTSGTTPSAAAGRPTSAASTQSGASSTASGTPSEDLIDAASCPPDDPQYTALSESCLAADTDILSALLPGEPISGSTGVIVLIKSPPLPSAASGLAGRAGVSPRAARPTIYCANVGDSRAVLCRAGRKIDLSFDHKPTRPDEAQRIEAAGGRVIKGRLHGVLAVSRAFGDAEHKMGLGSECWGVDFTADPLSAEPEITRVTVHPQDEFIVLACDGVYDVMTSQQVVNFVRRRLLHHRDVGRAARELVRKAIALNSVDNVTAIVVALNQQ